MSTKIELQYPYKGRYKTGYLNINSEGRRILVLKPFKGNLTSTAYARYLLACHLGRFLTTEEQVDHIDNDKTNDVVENLQILSHSENNIKKVEHLGLTEKTIKLECPVCGEIFYRKAHRILHKLKKGKLVTCSRVCGGKVSHMTKCEKDSLSPQSYTLLKR